MDYQYPKKTKCPNMTEPIKVAIADDHVLFRAGVKSALSMHNDHSMISKLMELGANSYLTKNSDSEIIYQAIKTVHEQEYFFNQLTNKALIDGLRIKRQAEASLPVDAKLSDKEITILRMICEEKSTKEIADLVELSPRTVEAIRDKLKVKTGAKSLAGLVMYAVKSGIIENRPIAN